MSDAPMPPFLPSDLEAFAQHVPDHIPEWYKYCCQAYEYIEKVQITIADANEKSTQTELRTHALEQEIRRLKHDNEIHQSENLAVIRYQKGQLQEMEQKYFEALKAKDRAILLATPAVHTPLSAPSSEPLAENPAALATRTPPPATTTPSEGSRLSERLPDPDKFEGDRKDLRRFISQIHEKMNVNRDRFPTPQSRMTYVTNRLKGQPYAQILPYIQKGICQLPDYEDILSILDRAFGDPNRVNNARNDLFRLRQTHKDFGTFFAEFQRLALEGEMSEDALPTLLEQAISRELRSMLMHNEPPSYEYHKFANFLQDLENRRRHYETIPTPAPKTYAVVSKPATHPVPIRSNQSTYPSAPRSPAPTKPRDLDAMDLGVQRRYQNARPTTRSERGECYRCGSANHLVRDCPLPDSRPVRMAPVRGRSRSSSSRNSGKTPSPAPTHSVNGVSLG